MPGWLPRVLIRIRKYAERGEVRFTLKALQEVAALGLGLDAMDVCDILARLRGADSAGRVRSTSTGEWLYIFTPRIVSTVLYVKLLLRGNCVVVSFHENEWGGDDASE